MKDLQELTKVNEESLPRIYCDMDQVLVAFLSGVKKITGQDFQKMNRVTRWEQSFQYTKVLGKSRIHARGKKITSKDSEI